VWDEYDLDVEIEGVQHLDAAIASRDVLKQNAAAVQGRVVLRIPNYAFRTNPEPFLDQMEAVFRARGWDPLSYVRGSGRPCDQNRGRKRAS
jgi:very-short-patch-repair endonuclease